MVLAVCALPMSAVTCYGPRTALIGQNSRSNNKLAVNVELQVFGLSVTVSAAGQGRYRS